MTFSDNSATITIFDLVKKWIFLIITKFHIQIYKKKKLKLVEGGEMGLYSGNALASNPANFHQT